MTRQAKAKAVQRLIAVPFIGLGGWCLLHPASVEMLALRPEHRHDSTTTAVLIGCFGAQAMLAGILVLFSTFTRQTFLVFGLALLPFFAFNYALLFVWPVFTAWMALDFLANIMMLGLCIAGWRLADPSAEDRWHGALSLDPLPGYI